VTSPVEIVVIDCPGCGERYEDWWRPSINLGIDAFDEDYLREASTGTCPRCGLVVDIGSVLVVEVDER
jgi:predicted RNA-binding Zn-ribbon protein involved in translation (DUF1610 family)